MGKVTKLPRRWKPGDKLTAKHLDEAPRAIRDLLRSPYAKSLQGGRANPNVQLAQMKIVAIADDYLICYRWDGTEEDDTEIEVAKPFLLRRTPFDGASRDGISYTYTATDARTATNGSDTEDQVIVP